MKYILVTLFFLITLVIILPFFHERGRSPGPKMSLIIEIGNIVGKKHDLHLSAYGGKFDNGIKLIDFSYNRYGNVMNVEESREFIVKCLNDILLEVNKNVDIRPHLLSYPFTIKDISLDIDNYDENGRDVKAPFILVTSAWEGLIIYKTQAAEQYRFDRVKEETYDEAVKILKEQHPIK